MDAKVEVRAPIHGIRFSEAVRVWARVAALSFGGPAGQIAVMHRIVVEEKRWIGETRFLHALNYCHLLPGPEAQQLAIYFGWLLHKTKGGLVAGILFVLPGAIAIMALSWIYVLFGHISLITALFFGLKAAVLAIVIEAVLRIGRRALKNNVLVGIAGTAFVALAFFRVPFPIVVLGAGLIGYCGNKAGHSAFMPGSGHATIGGRQVSDRDSALGEAIPEHARPSVRWALKVASIALVLWCAPTVVLLALFGSENVFAQIAVYFSKTAVVSFGGAYAVLSYVAQQAVDHFRWLKPGEMLDGLGMAETTPGPLIMVTQFVGFLGAYRSPGELPPLVAGTLGGLLTTWVTFTPCFLWIFLGAPFIEAMRTNKALSAALSAVTAAVVGVILNLALWFAIHTIFRQIWPVQGYGLAFDAPVLASVDPWALVLSIAAAGAVFRFNIGMIPTLLVTSLAGILLQLSGLLHLAA